MTYRSPLLDRPGAVPADPPDVGVAAHYGDPLREQRALLTGAGVVDRSHRGVLRVSGPDRHGWLHTLTSQHLSALLAGAGTESLVLTANGRVEHHLLLAEDGEASWIDVEPGSAVPLADYLIRMKFWSQVEVADVSSAWAVLSLVGPDTHDVLSAAGLPAPVGGYAVGSSIDAAVRRMPWPGEDAADLLVPRDRLLAVVDRLVAASAPIAGVLAYEALRAQARRPRLGLDTDDRTIPHEVGWIGVAVHLNKGCYRGQETVARVHNLGRPPRRLVLLHLDGSESLLPVAGDPVTLDGVPVGTVTTAARHADLGPVALAVLKRSVTDDAVLVAGGPDRQVAARIEPPEDDAAADGPTTQRRPKPALARMPPRAG